MLNDDPSLGVQSTLRSIQPQLPLSGGSFQGYAICGRIEIS